MLKTTKIVIIPPVPMSHIAYKNWPRCIHCHEVRAFDTHRCMTIILGKGK